MLHSFAELACLRAVRAAFWRCATRGRFALPLEILTPHPRALPACGKKAVVSPVNSPAAAVRNLSWQIKLNRE